MKPRFRREWLVAIILVASACPSADAAPSFEEVRSAQRSSESLLMDRNGLPLQEVRTDRAKRQLEWVELDSISPVLIRAVVFSEDRRFYQHDGVDWVALVRSAGQNLLGDRVQGASTISMQLASLIEPGLRPEGKKTRRKIGQKISQLRLAREIEESWSKSQILEAYLNLLSFRGENQGIASASAALFAKAPHGITTGEALILASLIRSPQASSKEVLRRACRLGRDMSVTRDCAEVDHVMTSQGLRYHSIPADAAWAPHVSRKLIEQGVGKSSLDRDLQRAVSEVLRHQIRAVEGQNAQDAAAVVLDNRTGEVLAYVGGLGDLSSARFVDGASAFRQAGSTLKPFLYALAFEKGYITESTLLEDSSLEIPVSGGIYRPLNHDHEFHGQISVRSALASSLNVPAVRVLGMVGIDAFVRRLKDLGFSSLQDADFYGPSLALGSADVKLIELTNAYRVLANSGYFSDIRWTPIQSGTKVPVRRIYSADAVRKISAILSDRESRSLTFGLENPLSGRFWSAAKTGTSKDMRDNWCVGYSERYTVGVWVGNLSGSPMWDMTGMSGAAPAWAEIMKALNQKAGTPKGLPILAKASAPAPVLSPARILYPIQGMRIAYDPDIPSERQKVFFKARASGTGSHWSIDGQVMGPAEAWLEWAPARPGRHEVALVTENGNAIDRIQFEVRGGLDLEEDAVENTD